MSSSELVTTQHLTRKAIIYIRQSSPHQMFSNQSLLTTAICSASKSSRTRMV